MGEVIIAFLLLLVALIIRPAPKGFGAFRPSVVVSFIVFLSIAVNAATYGVEFKHPLVFWMYLGAALAFFVGDICSLKLIRCDRLVPNFQTFAKLRCKTTFWLLLVCAVAGILIMAYVFYTRLHEARSIIALPMVLRYEAVYGKHEIPQLTKMLFAAGAIGSVFLINDNPKYRRIGYIIYTLLIMSCLVNMERAGIAIIVISGTFLTYYRTRSFRSFIVPGLIVLTLFIGVAFALGKEGGHSRGGHGKYSFVISYIAYPLHAFDEVVYDLPATKFGRNTIVPLVPGGSTMTGALLGWDKKDDGTPSVPRGAFNVYTFMQGGYMDFGLVGVLLICWIVGVLWGMVFNSIGKNLISLLMYSWLLYSCVMVFYTWQFSTLRYFYLWGIYCILLPKSVRIPVLSERLGNPMLVRDGSVAHAER
jgi:oligosaccharide repeat unit polymerase